MENVPLPLFLESVLLSMSLGFLVSVTDAAASTVFQTMLTVCHRKRPKLCKQLLKRIMEYLSSRNAAPGVRLESTLVQPRTVFCFEVLFLYY